MRHNIYLKYILYFCFYIVFNIVFNIVFILFLNKNYALLVFLLPLFLRVIFRALKYFLPNAFLDEVDEPLDEARDGVKTKSSSNECVASCLTRLVGIVVPILGRR